MKSQLSRTIFGDETSHTGGHEYLVYGTMFCDSDKVQPILNTLTASLGGRDFERGWNHSGFLHLYLRYVDAIFECRARYGLKFRCVVVNSREADHQKYNNSDAALGLEKYIFLHLLTYARDVPKGDPSLYVYLDKRSSKYKGETQKIVLNRRDRLEHVRESEIFKIVKDVESDEHLLVQAADVLAGAVGWVWNKRHEQNPGRHKLSLAMHIAWRAQIPIAESRLRNSIAPGDLLTLGYPTLPHIGHKGFHIWALDWKTEHIKEMTLRSREQLSCFPPSMRFGELDPSYKVDLICPRCDKTIPDLIATRPLLRERAMSALRRPICSDCKIKTQALIFIRPDPAEVTTGAKGSVLPHQSNRTSTSHRASSSAL